MQFNILFINTMHEKYFTVSILWLQKSRLIVRIKDLEMQLEKERDLHRKQMAALRGQRDSLEREINEYRTLLEAEEAR